MSTTIILEAIAKVNADPAQKSIATLEQELEFLKERFKGLAVGDAEFTKIGNRIREVQSELKTLDERFEGLGAEQKATAIAESFNVVVGAVGAVSGALVAFGVESKVLEDAEKRLLGIITVVTSLREVSNGLQSFIKIWPLLTANVVKATAAIRAFALANPFTAIAAGVIALTAALYALATAETEEEKANKKALATAKLRLQNLEDSESRTLSFARAQGLAAETVLEFEQASIKARIAEIDRILALEKNGEEYARLSEEQRKLLDREIELGLELGKLKEDQRQEDIKTAAENKKQAEERKKQRDKELAEEKKRLEELRVARLKSAQEGAEGLFALEQQLLQDIRDLRLGEIETGLDAFALFTIDDETLELVKADLIEKEGILRETRLKELDKTTFDLLKQNEDYFAKVIEGLGFGSEAYIAEEKKFQAVRAAILAADSEARRKITTDETNEIFNANFKLAKMLNELAKGEGEKLLSIEDGTYKERKDAVIKYYDAVIAAAKAAGLKVEELERQKSDALKSIDDGRKKDIEEGFRNTLSTFSTFLSTQRDIIDSQLQADLLSLGNNEAAKNQLREQAFEKQKKLRIAEATISGITGAVDAFTSVQNLNKLIPGLGIAVGGVLAGLVLATTGQQIALIQNSSLSGGSISSTGFNNVPSGGISLPGGGGVSTTPSLGAGLPGLGGGRLAGAPTIGTIGQEPIRAYVLAGDVTNGVQANIALNNRRRLSAG